LFKVRSYWIISVTLVEAKKNIAEGVEEDGKKLPKVFRKSVIKQQTRILITILYILRLVC
jgi:hypothetical protein